MTEEWLNVPWNIINYKYTATTIRINLFAGLLIYKTSLYK